VFGKRIAAELTGLIVYCRTFLSAFLPDVPPGDNQRFGMQ
jgi:hypothetical protein